MSLVHCVLRPCQWRQRPDRLQRALWGHPRMWSFIYWWVCPCVLSCLFPPPLSICLRCCADVSAADQRLRWVLARHRQSPLEQCIPSQGENSSFCHKFHPSLCKPYSWNTSHMPGPELYKLSIVPCNQSSIKTLSVVWECLFHRRDTRSLLEWLAPAYGSECERPVIRTWFFHPCLCMNGPSPTLISKSCVGINYCQRPFWI